MEFKELEIGRPFFFAATCARAVKVSVGSVRFPDGSCESVEDTRVKVFPSICHNCGDDWDSSKGSCGCFDNDCQ